MKITARFPELSEKIIMKSDLGRDRMIKQLLNSVIAKYRDLSVSRRSRYFAQPRPIIVNSPSTPVSFLHKLIYFLLLLYQGPSCSAQNNDVFIPSPKVKTLEPKPTASTPLPVTEKNLWGLRLWQVVGLAFVATILLSEYYYKIFDRLPLDN